MTPEHIILIFFCEMTDAKIDIEWSMKDENWDVIWRFNASRVYFFFPESGGASCLVVSAA